MENTTTKHNSSLGWLGATVFLLISLFLLQDANHSDSGFRMFISGFLVLFFVLILLFKLVNKAD